MPAPSYLSLHVMNNSGAQIRQRESGHFQALARQLTSSAGPGAWPGQIERARLTCGMLRRNGTDWPPSCALRIVGRLKALRWQGDAMLVDFLYWVGSLIPPE